MVSKWSPESLTIVSGALGVSSSGRDDQAATEGAKGNDKERKKKCPLCNSEYPQLNNYCRTDGTRLEVTNEHLVERF